MTSQHGDTVRLDGITFPVKSPWDKPMEDRSATRHECWTILPGNQCIGFRGGKAVIRQKCRTLDGYELWSGIPNNDSWWILGRIETFDSKVEFPRRVCRVWFRPAKIEHDRLGNSSLKLDFQMERRLQQAARRCGTQIQCARSFNVF